MKIIVKSNKARILARLNGIWVDHMQTILNTVTRFPTMPKDDLKDVFKTASKNMINEAQLVIFAETDHELHDHPLLAMESDNNNDSSQENILFKYFKALLDDDDDDERPKKGDAL